MFLNFFLFYHTKWGFNLYKSSHTIHRCDCWILRGYPAIPDLQDHTKLFELLPIRSATGVEITESYQFVPEQTTAAIVVHHQQAVYFAVRTEAEVAQI